MISTNDKILIFVSGTAPYSGNLMDPVSVFTVMSDTQTGPPLNGQAAEEQEAQREYAAQALEQLKGSRPAGLEIPPAQALGGLGAHALAAAMNAGSVSPAPFVARPASAGTKVSSEGKHDDGAGTASTAAKPAAAPFDMTRLAVQRRGSATGPMPDLSQAKGRTQATASRRASVGAPNADAVRREHSAPARAPAPTKAAAAATGVNTASQRGAGAGERKNSIVGNQKLKRVVAKLVLINRFNKTAALGAAASTAKSMAGSSGGASGVLSSSGKFKSRWGRRSIIGKTLDQYIKESNNIYSYVEQRRLAETDEKLPWYILRPDAPWRLSWDFLVLGLVLYFSITVPIKLGFDQVSEGPEKIFDYVADVLFIFDIVLNFMTTFNEDGVWVSDRHRVAVAYAISWFPMDVLASFPVGWITDLIALFKGDAANNNTGINKVLRMLRMFKLFRMLRMLKLFPKLFAVVETNVKVDPSILRFVRSFVILLIMWHLIACAYWFVVLDQYNGVSYCPPPYDTARLCFTNLCLCDPASNDPALRLVLPNTNPRWYDPDNLDLFVVNPAFANQAFEEQYGQAMMFAVSATTSIGQNIVPRDGRESGFAIFIILIGLMLYSLVIGAAGSALANLDSQASAKKQVLDKIVTYMRSRKVPTFFQKIIMDYYKHVWSSPGGQDAAMLEDLPPMLRSRLQVIMNRDIIERFPIMQMMNMETYLRMVARLKTNTYLPGEYIYKQGDTGDELFFIKKGKVDAVLPNGVTVFQTLKPGAFFGEHSMLYLTKRDASTRAVDFVDVYTLHRGDFTELYISAPEFIRELQRIDEYREKDRLKQEVTFLKKAQGENKGKDAKITVTKVGEDDSDTPGRGTDKAGGSFSSFSVGKSMLEGFKALTLPAWVKGSGKSVQAGAGSKAGSSPETDSTKPKPVATSTSAVMKGLKTLSNPAVEAAATGIDTPRNTAPVANVEPSTQAAPTVAAGVGSGSYRASPGITGSAQREVVGSYMSVATATSATEPKSILRKKDKEGQPKGTPDRRRSSQACNFAGPAGIQVSTTGGEVTSSRRNSGNYGPRMKVSQQSKPSSDAPGAIVTSTSLQTARTDSSAPAVPSPTSRPAGGSAPIGSSAGSNQASELRSAAGIAVPYVPKPKGHTAFNPTPPATSPAPSSGIAVPKSGSSPGSVAAAVASPATTGAGAARSPSPGGAMFGSGGAATPAPASNAAGRRLSTLKAAAFAVRASITGSLPVGNPNSGSTRGGVKISDKPGADGYDIGDDIDLFGSPEDEKKKPVLAKMLSQGVRNFIPGAARRKELEDAKKAAAAEINKNPYAFKKQEDAPSDEDDDDEEVANVVTVVPEQAHTPQVDLPEPQGRLYNGKDRRASLRRPPTEELLRLSRDTPSAAAMRASTAAAGSSESKGALFPARQGGLVPSASRGRTSTEDGKAGTSAAQLPSGVPGQVSSPDHSPEKKLSRGGPSEQFPVRNGQTPHKPSPALTSLAVSTPPPVPTPATPAAPTTVTRMPSGPLEMTDEQLDALLEQVGGL